MSQESNAFVTQVPFNRLVRSQSNVRRTGRDSEAHRKKVEGLAQSILAIGQLHNLVVHPEGEFLAVDAGESRLEAFELLVNAGKVAADYPVNVLVIDAGNAVVASLAENVQRTDMHPADELDAFLALTEQGWTIDSIADAFGVTPLVVERRLKLRAAAPELLDEFRAGKMSTDQLIALCSTDDHERQVTVWKRAQYDYARQPANLRQAVLGGEVRADRDLRVGFIGGISAYEQAGGGVRRDLFAESGVDVILTDPSLLDALVTAKLHEQAEEVGCEGWGWVEVWNGMDHTAYSRLGHAPKVRVELPVELQEELAALAAEQEELRNAIEELYNGEDELTDEETERLSAHESRVDQIENRQHEIETSARAYTPELRAVCGALVVYERGSATIHRGLVRTADRSAVNAVLGDGQSINGGRETAAAGRRADEISDALRKSLVGHRNLAAQYATAENPRAAKLLLICRMVADLRSQYGTVPTDLEVSRGWGARTNCPITDDAGIARAKEFEDLGGKLLEALPREMPMHEVWDALEAMEDSELDQLLAYAVARSVSLSEKPEGAAGAVTGRFLQAIELDMAAHFTPTASNYLGRVSKELIIEALAEAGKVEAGESERLLDMKKSALAAEAERRLAGSGWVPAVIRTAPVQAQGKAAKPKKNGRKAAAKASQ